MILYLGLFMILFIFGNLIFILNRKHFLNILLILEYLMLVLFFFFMLIIVNIFNEDYCLMLFMVMMVSEGVLGLAILVSLVRLVGNDYFQIFNLMGMC
uniref:NADH-ubiquinone oxidoreductase chain 4L n=1 Tax=Potamyia flava TaxID=761880 RepID=A0A3G1NDL2_9NEOP|nr:NADH dehydrogenase subunit 4L [Potamyia flava]AUT18182.1 NADH dehydrogenase subunit 4L [Potamyia flava]